MINIFMKKYKIFNELLIRDKCVSKIHRNCCYATQGCCFINDSYYITCYDTKYDQIECRNDKLYSILDIINVNGKFKTLYFDNKSHVGGISFCGLNNKLYVSGNNCVNYYDLYYINSLNDGDKILEYNTYLLNYKKDKIINASYLNICGNSLFVGEFKKYSSSTLNIYSLLNDGSVQYIKTYKVPLRKIQGMCIYNYNGIYYYIFSCSYGRKNVSKLYICGLIDNKFKKVYVFNVPSMSEQISLDNNGNLVIVFESDCIKYSKHCYKNNMLFSGLNICVLDIKKLFDSLEM